MRNLSAQATNGMARQAPAQHLNRSLSYATASWHGWRWTYDNKKPMEETNNGAAAAQINQAQGRVYIVQGTVYWKPAPCRVSSQASPPTPLRRWLDTSNDELAGQRRFGGIIEIAQQAQRRISRVPHQKA